MGNADMAREDDRFRDIARKGRSGFSYVQPTQAQELKRQEAMAALVWKQPFFAHLLFDKMEIRWTNDVPIAATDETVIFLNPEAFGKFTVDERVFIIAHEVFHGVFGHCSTGWRLKLRGHVEFSDGSKLPYDDEVMNHALDYVINAMLVEGNIGRYNPKWLHDPNIAKGDDSTIDAYRKVYRKRQQGGGGGGGGQGSGPQGKGSGGAPGAGKGQPGQGQPQEAFDQHLQPGTGTGQEATQAAQGRDEQGWKTAVAQAAALARLQGKLPANFDRFIDELLEPAIDWREFIEGYLARTLGGGGYDWNRGDRRFLVRKEPIYVPARSGHGCGTVVVAVDTSGSIGQRELALFFGCISGILQDVKPRRIVVIWCDAKVGRVDEIEDAGDLGYLRSKGAPGGGGTDFRPVFDEVARMGLSPDCLCYLTDTYGTFPDGPPEYPVLWAKICDASVPWGAEVRIPDEEAGR